MYDNLIDYQTGDSFNSEDVIGESVGIVVTSLSLAKENLRRIKHHYEKYNEDYQTGSENYELELLTDNGGTRTIRPFWVGVF